jgi:hypothetical protein
MSASIDNLINVNFTKGRNDLLNFGLKLGGKGDYRPPQFDAESLKFEYIDANESYGIDLNGSRFLQKLTFAESQDFTRATTGTFIGSNGQIQTAAIDAPRFTHDPVTREVQGLLIEEQRTNLITYSEQFDNAAWSKTGASISADATIAPDGLTSADAVTEDSGGISEHKVIQSMTTIAGEIAFTVFVKKKDGGRDWFFIREGINGSLTNSFYNIEDGTLGAIGSGKIGSIENAGNGWFRVALTQTATAQTSNLSFGIAESDGIFNYTGDGTSGVYIWGAQLEQGSSPTSYIPTTGTQVTRASDNCVRVLGAEFNPGAFTIYCDYEREYVAPIFPGPFIISDGSTDNRILLDSFAGNDRIVITSNGVSVVGSNIGTSVPGRFRVAISLTDTACLVAVNGTAYSFTGLTNAIPTGLNSLVVGRRSSNIEHFLNGVIRDFRIFPTALSDAELITLTGGT